MVNFKKLICHFNLQDSVNVGFFVMHIICSVFSGYHLNSWTSKILLFPLQCQQEKVQM